MTGLRTNTTRNADGSLTTVIYNQHGKEVAKLESHRLTVDEMLSLARRFRDDHPELFSVYALIDTAAESERKNPDQFSDDLEPVPGN